VGGMDARRGPRRVVDTLIITSYVVGALLEGESVITDCVCSRCVCQVVSGVCVKLCQVVSGVCVDSRPWRDYILHVVCIHTYIVVSVEIHRFRPGVLIYGMVCTQCDPVQFLLTILFRQRCVYMYIHRLKQYKNANAKRKR
jgi:hypothetical protein